MHHYLLAPPSVKHLLWLNFYISPAITIQKGCTQLLVNKNTVAMCFVVKPRPRIPAVLQ